MQGRRRFGSVAGSGRHCLKVVPITSKDAVPRRMRPMLAVSRPRLGIPFYALDLARRLSPNRRLFRGRLPGWSYTESVRSKCNHWIKFGRLFDYAEGVDADFLATGHYAQMDSMVDLHRGIRFEQGPVLRICSVFERERLGRMLLPVGGYTKPRDSRDCRIARIGRRRQKRTVRKSVSSRKVTTVTFVKARRPDMVGATSGEIVTVDGDRRWDVIKVTKRFTVGQRKGTRRVAMGSPHFRRFASSRRRRNVVIGPQEALLPRRVVRRTKRIGWSTHRKVPDQVSRTNSI